MALVVPFANIFVKGLDGITRTFDNITSATSVSQLKEMILERTGLPVDEQRLIYAGKELTDGRRMEDFNVQNESTIMVVIRLKGGAEMYYPFKMMTRSQAKMRRATGESEERKEEMVVPKEKEKPKRKKTQQAKEKKKLRKKGKKNNHKKAVVVPDEKEEPVAMVMKEEDEHVKTEEDEKEDEQPGETEKEKENIPPLVPLDDADETEKENIVPPPLPILPALAPASALEKPADVKEAEKVVEPVPAVRVSSKILTAEIATSAGIKIAADDALCMIKQERDKAEPRAEMPCGHAITPEGLAALANSVTGLASVVDGQEVKRAWRITCPEIVNGKDHCGREWPWSLVRVVAMLDGEDRSKLEFKLSINFVTEGCAGKSCPTCQCIITPANDGIAPTRVECRMCVIKNNPNSSFCWQCLAVWRAPKTAGNVWCGNFQCVSTRSNILMTLQTAEVLQLPMSIQCYAVRACPRCLLLKRIRLVAHSGTGCKHLQHTGIGGCGLSFCATYLAIPTPEGIWPCGNAYAGCLLAARQTAAQLADCNL